MASRRVEQARKRASHDTVTVSRANANGDQGKHVEMPVYKRRPSRVGRRPAAQLTTGVARLKPKGPRGGMAWREPGTIPSWRGEEQGRSRSSSSRTSTCHVPVLVLSSGSQQGNDAGLKAMHRTWGMCRSRTARVHQAGCKSLPESVAAWSGRAPQQATQIPSGVRSELLQAARITSNGSFHLRADGSGARSWDRLSCHRRRGLSADGFGNSVHVGVPHYIALMH